MDSKLKALFDFQHFQEDPRLKRVIQSAESHCSQELSDDELLLVSAAGEATVPPAEEQALDPVGAIMVLEGEET